MKSITRHVERSTQEQTRGSRQITRAVEMISEMVSQLADVHRNQAENVTKIITRLDSLEAATRRQLDRTHVMRGPGAA
jgi:methyl-accepting chemotaxis protein